MNKFDRVVSILVLLQTKRKITASELAERFEVSLRTIYRKRRKDRPATPRGFPSTSRKRRLKGDKGCDCDEFEDFREQYTDIVADGVRNGSLNSILEVLDMFIVDPFPCPNAEGMFPETRKVSRCPSR